MLYRALLVFSTIILAACSGGGGGSSSQSAVGSDEFLSGQISGITISGLGYETATQSGTLDANGRFTYRTGESITFMLGSTEIASTTASANIDLPALLVAQLPIDAESLLREFGPQHNVTDFDRAINRVTLLLALDQEPATEGIQLGLLHDELASAETFNFDYPMSRFVSESPNDLVIRQGGGDPNADYRDTIALLYELAGILIESEQITLVSETFDLSAPAIETFLYDANGFVERRAVNTDGQGAQEERYEFTWTADGKLKTIDAEKPSGSSTSVYTYTASKTSVQQSLGGTINLTEYDLDSQGRTLSQKLFSNGVLLSKTSYEYDDLGRLRFNRVHHPDTDIVTEETETQYDDMGRVLRVLEDFNGDGIDERITFYRYEAENLAEILVDFEFDASFDASYRLTYDAQGRLSTEEVDADNNGSVDEMYSYHYDQWSNLVRTEVDVDYATNPGADEISTKSYDELGNLINESFDIDGDGQPEFARTYTHTLLNHVESITEESFDASGALIEMHNYAYQYQSNTLSDGLHNLLRPEIARLPN